MRARVAALVAALWFTVAVALTASATTPPEPPASAGGTTVETLCVEGLLPDGTYFDCP